MNEKDFEELAESVREGGQILRGEAAASRQFSHPLPDIKRIRAEYGLSQAAFARMLGISAGTLRNWEQGRRRPDGPARMLLRIASEFPETLLRVAGFGSTATGNQ